MNQRQINFKFLLGLIISIVVLAVGVRFVHGFQVRRQADALLRQAEAAAEEDNLPRALDYLTRYLGFRPDDNDALARYGELLDTEGRQTKSPRLRYRAFNVLEDALRRLPEDETGGKWRGVRRRQVDLAIDMANSTAAVTHAKTLLDGNLTWADEDRPLTDGERAELEQRIGLAEELRKQYARAVHWYEKAADHDPGQIATAVRIAVLWRLNLDAPAKADQLMEGLIDRITKSDRVAKKDEVLFLAHLARARYYIGFFPGEVGQRRDTLKEKARKDVEAVKVQARAENAAEDIEKYLVEAEFAQAREDIAEARDVLRKGVAAHPKNLALTSALTEIEAADGKIQDAIKLTLAMLEDHADRPDLLFRLAELRVQEREPGKLAPLVDKLQEQNYRPERVGYLKAQLHMLREEWGKAGPILENNRLLWRDAPRQEGQVNFLLGHCYEQLSNPDQVLIAYQRALKLQPASLAARRAVAGALLTLGRSEEALAEYRQIQRFARRPADSRMMVARLLIDRIVRQPADQKRDWTEVKSELTLAAKELSTLANNGPEAEATRQLRDDLTLLQADVLLLEDPKQIDKVRSQLRQEVKAHPERVEFWLALANLDGRENKPAAALQTLAEAEKTLPAGPDDRTATARRAQLRLARFTYLARRPEPEASAALAQEEKGVADWADEVRLRLMDGLAGAYARMGATADAERLWQLVGRERPGDLPLRLRLLDRALAAGKDDEVRAMLSEIRSIEGELGTYWRFGEACRLVVRARAESKDKLTDTAREWLHDARGYLDDAAQRRPSWHRVPALQGEIADLEGHPETASERYQAAVTLGDRRPAVIRRLVQHLFEQKRYADVGKIMRELREQEQSLLLAGLGKLASLTKLGSGDQSGALELALKAVAPDSKDYRDQVFLGQLYEAANKKPQAEKAFRRACELSPDMPDPWVTLVVFLARTDRKADAEAAIEQLRKGVPADKATLALASCYAVIGQTELAEKQYQAALAAQPSDRGVLRSVAAFYLTLGQLGKAEPHLRKALEVSEQEDVAGARRGLAAVLAVTPSQRQFEEALALLDVNIRTNGARLEDRRLKASLLATRPSHRKSAIALFEDVKREQPLRTDEQFVLFRLYEADGNWPQAQETMLVLLGSTAGQKNVPLRANYTRRLIQRGKIDEAEQQLRALHQIRETNDPNDPKALKEEASLAAKEIEARLQRARGDHTKALAMLQEYAASKDALPLGAAILAEEFGQDGGASELYRKETERMYRKYANESKAEGRHLALASFFARQGRIDETHDACEEALRDEAAPEVVASVLVAALRTGDPSAEQLRRADQWLQDAVAKAKDPDALLMSLADLRDLQERYQEAEALYTKVLSRKPGHLLALNNLAWLLAMKEGRPEDALGLMARAMDLVGQTPELLDTRGCIYLKLGKVDLAIQDFQACIDQTPSPTRYFHLALAQQLANKGDAAREAWQKARGLNVKELHALERPDYQKLLAALDRS
jgi:Tfp pilus assembly protein PilF